jgi:hypothetical protein
MQNKQNRLYTLRNLHPIQEFHTFQDIHISGASQNQKQSNAVEEKKIKMLTNRSDLLKFLNKRNMRNMNQYIGNSLNKYKMKTQEIGQEIGIRNRRVQPSPASVSSENLSYPKKRKCKTNLRSYNTPTPENGNYEMDSKFLPKILVNQICLSPLTATRLKNKMKKLRNANKNTSANGFYNSEDLLRKHIDDANSNTKDTRTDKSLQLQTSYPNEATNIKNEEETEIIKIRESCHVTKNESVELFPQLKNFGALMFPLKLSVSPPIFILFKPE